jgi:hypothetical protein
MFEKRISTEMWWTCSIYVFHFSSKLKKCMSGYITLHPSKVRLFMHYLTWKIVVLFPTKSFEDSRTKDSKYFCIQLNKKTCISWNEWMSTSCKWGWVKVSCVSTYVIWASAITVTSSEDLLLAAVLKAALITQWKLPRRLFIQFRWPLPVVCCYSLHTPRWNSFATLRLSHVKPYTLSYCLVWALLLEKGLKCITSLNHHKPNVSWYKHWLLAVKPKNTK